MENPILEELHKAHNLVLKLAKEIDVKNQRLLEMEQQIDAISTSLSIMTVEKDGLQQAHDRGVVTLYKLKIHIIVGFPAQRTSFLCMRTT
ncbi:hypothetical protein L6164_025950 [Bauhinia variegata]|uniref:Uncharacterized protein n=1 Tax=Bauhinia variegata TaxID=167791 RepID=A0ACB9M294_BAUVA|nr:hypothetical protein L6164_025950 [Bauhinia variegata]